MNKIGDLENGIPINQVLGSTTEKNGHVNGKLDKENIRGSKIEGDPVVCLFSKILGFQAFFGLTYGGSVCYFGNSKTGLKLRRFLLVCYELIITISMSIYYLYYFNKNEHIFKMNVKKPAMKMMLRLAADSYILTFIVFKVVLLVNGSAILKTIATFKGQQTKVESKVITNSK